MHCTEHHTMRTRLLHTLAAAALSVAGLLLLPAANAQMNPPQARPQAQSPSPAISDAKLPTQDRGSAVGQTTPHHRGERRHGEGGY